MTVRCTGSNRAASVLTRYTMAIAIIVDEHLTDCPLLPVEKSRTHALSKQNFWEKIILLVITDGNLTLLRVPASFYQ